MKNRIERKWEVVPLFYKISGNDKNGIARDKREAYFFFTLSVALSWVSLKLAVSHTVNLTIPMKLRLRFM